MKVFCCAKTCCLFVVACFCFVSAAATEKSAVSTARTEAPQAETQYEPTYYVGQDLGDAYVYYVNESESHGWVVSKDFIECHPGKVYEQKFNSGSNRKWRLPRVNDLTHIYNALKQHYPRSGYLAATERDLNFKCVVFDKKKSYTSRVNDKYTYNVLYVAPF